MRDVYDATALTPLRVARSGGYIDWASQPALFKHYPDFLYRIGFDAHPDLAAAALVRCITFESTVGGKPYYRLNTPSAGNLHPVELYVQIRGLKGVLSGIYHVDALHSELVLLRECGEEGVEPLLGLEHRFVGMLFLISVVPFRSEWKYGHRAWRYCYMDAGHQLGALHAAMQASGRQAEVLDIADAPALNRMMGFGSEEFIAAAVAVGEEGGKPARAPETPLMRVAPTDYCESDGTVGGWIAQMQRTGLRMSGPKTDADETLQRQRRSARSFSATGMPREAFERIMHTLEQIPEGIKAYTVVLRPEHAEPGLYMGGERLKAGAFADTMAALLVDQRFVAAAEIVTVLCSESYSAALQMEAAAFAHALSMEAAARKVGYTAIGAFYDKKMQKFLTTSEYILYVGVLGTEK